MSKAIIICGPTASGKSIFAHQFAKKYNGEIVNSDSRQVYKQIPVITASPSPALTAELPYHLYNFLDIDQEFSGVKYTKLAAEKIRTINNQGKLPIIVGGTGMYINLLLFGYNQIPPITNEITEYSRNLQQQIGQIEFFNQLTALDPIAARLNQLDKQRTLRAYEVFKQTGQSIFIFQENNNIIPLPEFEFKVIFLYPERNFLYSVCNERLKSIFEQGAIEEIKIIKKIFSKTLSGEEQIVYNKQATPLIRKVIGIQEIINYLEGLITLEQALKLTQAKTRQYAKRQITWFKHQLKEKITIQYSSNHELETFLKKIGSFIGKL